MMVSAVQDLQDRRRVEPTYLLGERDMLEGWLEFHRTTLLLKCEGLDDAARKSRPVPTSLLSLHGLVRHMAEVERSWFRRTLLREPDLPYIYCGTQDWDDQDLVPLDDADWGTDLAIWKAECEASRQAAASHSLDDTGIRRGDAVSLRWIYTHMVEEYARHNGHADLIRELIDGAVGW
jgi:uncharacterized damage-inducible protein DinB